MKRHVTVSVTGVDWRALRQQKARVLRLRDDAHSQADIKALSGIIHLIDHIQDEAASVLGAAKVFGKHWSE